MLKWQVMVEYAHSKFNRVTTQVGDPFESHAAADNARQMLANWAGGGKRFWVESIETEESKPC